MISISLKKLTLATAITAALFSNQLLFAGDVEISLPDAESAFTVDQPVGSELMRVNGDGNVGIGTETPSSKLHIKAATTPRVLFEDASRMFSTGISGDNFSIGNVVDCSGTNMYGNQIVVDGTGETGINTSSPEAELHIKNKLGGVAACSQSATSFPASLMLEGGKKWKFTSWDQPPVVFPDFTPDGQRLGILNETNDEIMSFYGDGSIGIGKTDPREKLDVAGNIKASGTVCDSTGCIGDSAGGKFINGDTAIDAVFTTGNVGIGVADPSSILTVKSGGIGDAPAAVQNGDDLGHILQQAYAGGDYHSSAQISFKTDGAIGADYVPSKMQFETTADTGGNKTVHMTIKNDGNIGIGTASPVAGLHVSKGINDDWAAIIYNGGGNGQGLSVRASDANGNQTTPVFEVTNNLNTTSFMRVQENGRVGIGVSNPSTTLHISGSLTQNSDERLKKDITPLKSSLEKITQLQGVSFNWKDADKHEKGIQLGLIAQEVEKVIPEVVSTSDDEQGTKSVAYTSLIAVLIEGMKEQQKRIEALETKLK